MIAATVSKRTGIERALWRLACTSVLPCLAGTLAAQPAFANTPAGTRISNTATLSAGPVGGRYTLYSNTAVLTADEVIDVAITAPTPIVSVAGAAAQVAVPFVVTNQGNGNEPIHVTATLGGAGATITGIAVDANNNGVYDAGSDPLIPAGGVATTPGQAQTVFVLVSVPTALAADIGVSATATAATGSGAPGTVFAGQGDTGGDAVIGKTGGTAQAQATLHPGVGAPTLVKSQSVLAADGTTHAIHGSVVTYTLEAHFPAASSAAEVTDAIPVSMTYVPGSLTLDDLPLSDATDTDAGTFDGSAIHVALGDVTAPVVRTIRFKTVIQ